MSELLSAIITFLNRSFAEKFQKISDITELSNPDLLYKILCEVEDDFFCNLCLLPNDTDTNKEYNLRIIYKRIISFFEYVVRKPIDDSYFDYTDKSPENFVKLGSLIIGVCAKSKKKEDYFEVMDDLSEKESDAIMQILIELIPVEEDKEKSNKSISNKKDSYDDRDDDEDDKANENAMLWIRAENAEKENERMSQEINDLHNKVTELTKNNFSLELNLKETESKYQELVASLKKEQGDEDNKKRSNVNLSIKISELKGKLEAKSKSFYEYQEEKERLVDELNTKIGQMRQENLILKENNVKYEVLKNEMKKCSFEEMSAIKQRLVQSEKLIKEKDIEINKLMSRDNQKVLLDKIEELNKNNTLLEEENQKLQEENDTIRQQLLIKDCEITQMKESLGIVDEGGEDKEKEEVVAKPSTGVTLGDLMEPEEKANTGEKVDTSEFETKIAELEKEKTQLNEKITELQKSLEQEKRLTEEKKEEIEKLQKKLEKHKNIKEENKTFISKITELMEKLDELKNENLKLEKTKNDVKNEYISQINNLQKELNDLKIQNKDFENKIIFLENDKSKSSTDISINSELLKNLEKQNSEEKFKEIEERLKMLTEKGSDNFAEQLKEKEFNYRKLNEKYKKLEIDYDELNKAMENVPIELQRRDEAIEYYKNQLDLKEKNYNEEMRILSSMYHRLSYQCVELRLTKERQNYSSLNI